jgi:hypothetical protein
VNRSIPIALIPPLLLISIMGCNTYHMRDATGPAKPANNTLACNWCTADGTCGYCNSEMEKCPGGAYYLKVKGCPVEHKKKAAKPAIAPLVGDGSYRYNADTPFTYSPPQAMPPDRAVDPPKITQTNNGCNTTTYIDGVPSITTSLYCPHSSYAPILVKNCPDLGRQSGEGCEIVQANQCYTSGKGWGSCTEEGASPEPITVIEPVTQPVLYCPDGWYVEIWEEAYCADCATFGIPPGPFTLPQSHPAGYFPYSKPMVIMAGPNTKSKDHPPRCVRNLSDNKANPPGGSHEPELPIRPAR